MRDDDDQLTGVVKWFSVEKGYGFITPDGVVPGKGSDVFVHFSAIETDKKGPRSLAVGARVTFELALDEDGRRRAVTVVEVDE